MMLSTKGAAMAQLRTSSTLAQTLTPSITTLLPNRSQSSSTTTSTTAKIKKTLVSKDVHSNMQLSKSWRNKPLFRRQGDVRFRTGLEAANLLVSEAKRRDEHETQFIHSVESNMQCLSAVFERNPRYAFVAKQLMEPERFIQFRVPWMDDTGVIRMNRGYRIQFSSSLGPYEGSLHLVLIKCFRMG
jgi:glutamate dehydrogenase (NADP+)